MKNVAVTVAAIAFGALTFIAGSYANTDQEVKKDEVQNCVYHVLQDFPTPEGKVVPECQGLSKSQKAEAYGTVTRFMDQLAG